MHEEVWLHALALLLLRCARLYSLETTDLAVASTSITRLGHVHRLRASDVRHAFGKALVSLHSFDGALCESVHVIVPAISFGQPRLMPNLTRPDLYRRQTAEHTLGFRPRVFVLCCWSWHDEQR